MYTTKEFYAGNACMSHHTLDIETMVLKLDGNSEISEQVRSDLCYLICLEHLIRMRPVRIKNFLKEFF